MILEPGKRGKIGPEIEAYKEVYIGDKFQPELVDASSLISLPT